MKLRALYACSTVLALGAVAYAIARSTSTPATSIEVSTGCKCCTAESIAPTACGDVDVVCPAGPDCFAPDVCLDHEVVFPADTPPAGS